MMTYTILWIPLVSRFALVAPGALVGAFKIFVGECNRLGGLCATGCSDEQKCENMNFFLLPYGIDAHQNHRRKSKNLSFYSVSCKTLSNYMCKSICTTLIPLSLSPSLLNLSHMASSIMFITLIACVSKKFRSILMSCWLIAIEWALMKGGIAIARKRTHVSILLLCAQVLSMWSP